LAATQLSAAMTLLMVPEPLASRTLSETSAALGAIPAFSPQYES